MKYSNYYLSDSYWRQPDGTVFAIKGDYSEIHLMYEYLDKRGILEKVSDEYTKTDHGAVFLLQSDKLIPHRKDMEAFNKELTDIVFTGHMGCEHCGAVTLSQAMRSYRSNYGTVGSVWECQVCYGCEDPQAEVEREDIKESVLPKKMYYVWKDWHQKNRCKTA